jgi:hypothetical protein
MSKSFVKISIALAATLFFYAAVALAEKGKTITVYYDSVLPNGQTLKAGDYAIHVDKTAHKVEFLQKGKVIAEAPCDCKEGKKNDKSQCVFKKDDKGKQILQVVQVGGDTKTIVLEAEGM